MISQDPLGRDRIFVQAKRYAEDRAIDRPKIHEFADALLGKQGIAGCTSPRRVSPKTHTRKPNPSTPAQNSSAAPSG
jgi:restriction endonuclease Mrr